MLVGSAMKIDLDFTKNLLLRITAGESAGLTGPANGTKEVERAYLSALQRSGLIGTMSDVPGGDRPRLTVPGYWFLTLALDEDLWPRVKADAAGAGLDDLPDIVAHALDIDGEELITAAE